MAGIESKGFTKGNQNACISWFNPYINVINSCCPLKIEKGLLVFQHNFFSFHLIELNFVDSKTMLQHR